MTEPWLDQVLMDSAYIQEWPVIKSLLTTGIKKDDTGMKSESMGMKNYADVEKIIMG